MFKKVRHFCLRGSIALWLIILSVGIAFGQGKSNVVLSESIVRNSKQSSVSVNSYSDVSMVYSKQEEAVSEKDFVEIPDYILESSHYTLGSLDEDGYLKTSCEEIAQCLGIDDLPRIEYILKIIQNFEPVGIASRSLKECLLSQVMIRSNGNCKLVKKIIEEHIEELGRKKYQNIARKLGTSLETVKNAAQIISLFEPKPARNYRPIKANLYIKPDIFITMDENEQYHIRINSDGNSPLRINTHYQRMLTRRNLTPEEKNFIHEKLKNALYFMKSIEQRGKTIKKITEFILDRQKEFFEKGHMHLAPMNLKDIAESIERNESTISRANVPAILSMNNTGRNKAERD